MLSYLPTWNHTDAMSMRAFEDNLRKVDPRRRNENIRHNHLSAQQAVLEYSVNSLSLPIWRRIADIPTSVEKQSGSSKRSSWTPISS